MLSYCLCLPLYPLSIAPAALSLDPLPCRCLSPSLAITLSDTPPRLLSMRYLPLTWYLLSTTIYPSAIYLLFVCFSHNKTRNPTAITTPIPNLTPGSIHVKKNLPPLYLRPLMLTPITNLTPAYPYPYPCSCPDTHTLTPTGTSTPTPTRSSTHTQSTHTHTHTNFKTKHATASSRTLALRFLASDPSATTYLNYDGDNYEHHYHQSKNQQNSRSRAKALRLQMGLFLLGERLTRAAYMYSECSVRAVL